MYWPCKWCSHTSHQQPHSALGNGATQVKQPIEEITSFVSNPVHALASIIKLAANSLTNLNEHRHVWELLATGFWRTLKMLAQLSKVCEVNLVTVAEVWNRQRSCHWLAHGLLNALDRVHLISREEHWSWHLFAGHSLRLRLWVCCLATGRGRCSYLRCCLLCSPLHTQISALHSLRVQRRTSRKIVWQWLTCRRRLRFASEVSGRYRCDRCGMTLLIRKVT